MFHQDFLTTTNAAAEIEFIAIASGRILDTLSCVMKNPKIRDCTIYLQAALHYIKNYSIIIHLDEITMIESFFKPFLK